MIKQKKIMEWVVALIVFFLVSSQVLESVARVAFPSFSLILDLIKWGCIAVLFVFHVKEKKKTHCNQIFLALFLLYSVYVLYYMTLGAVYPLGMLLAVPSSVVGYLFRLLFLLALIISSRTIFDFLNVKKILIVLILGCVIPSLIYINYIGVSTLQVYSVESFRMQYMDVLVLAYSNMPALLVAIFFYSKIAKDKRINFIFLTLVCLAVGYIDIVSTKRGPILWTLVVLLVMFFFQNKLKFKYMVMLIILCVSGYLLFDFVLDKIAEIAPLTAGRIRNAVYYGDTASRFDASQKGDSGYYLAVNQFLSSPVWGSYYRLISNGIFKGCYPHNVFLETMISMGLIGLIPMLYMVVKIFKKSFYLIRNGLNEPYKLSFLLFLSIFFSLFTTGTILLNYGFWTFMCMLSFPKKCYEDKINDL